MLIDIIVIARPNFMKVAPIIRDNISYSKFGTINLVGANYKKLRMQMDQISRGNWEDITIPPLFDSKSAERIVAHLVSFLSCNGRNKWMQSG